MAFDSVFNGDPRTSGVSSSGKATNGIDIASGQVYFKDDTVGGWQPIAGGSLTSSDVTNSSGVAGSTVTDALNTLNTGGGAGVVRTISVTLAPSQIKTLTATPVLLLAGVAGHIYILNDVIFEYVFNTTPYTDTFSETLSVQAGPTAGNPAGMQLTEPATNLLTASGSRYCITSYAFLNAGGANPVFPVGNSSGQSIYVTTDGAGDVTLGDGNLKVTLHYYDFLA